MSNANHKADYESSTVRQLREDLALALRAASFHGLSEGVCNHFSVEIPDNSGRFLLNPRGLLWSEVQADDIVMVDTAGSALAGRHPVEPTAMFIHAAVHQSTTTLCKSCVQHQTTTSSQACLTASNTHTESSQTQTNQPSHTHLLKSSSPVN